MGPQLDSRVGTYFVRNVKIESSKVHPFLNRALHHRPIRPRVHARIRRQDSHSPHGFRPAVIATPEPNSNGKEFGSNSEFVHDLSFVFIGSVTIDLNLIGRRVFERTSRAFQEFLRIVRESRRFFRIESHHYSLDF